MNSNLIQPQNPIFQNSGGPIKRDFGSRQEFVPSAFSQAVEDFEASLCGRTAVLGFGRPEPSVGLLEGILEGPSRLIGYGATIEFQRVAPGAQPDPNAWEPIGNMVDKPSRSGQSVGIVNDPAAELKTPEEIRDDFQRDFNGMRGDIIVFDECEPSGKPMSRAMLLEYLAEPRQRLLAVPVELSQHPGERQRQVERQQRSRRSRAGKAGRWS